MNWLLRIFGVRGIDRGEHVVSLCPECGQPVAENWILRPLTPLELAVADYEADYISAAQLEARVAVALSVSNN